MCNFFLFIDLLKETFYGWYRAIKLLTKFIHNVDIKKEFNNYVMEMKKKN